MKEMIRYTLSFGSIHVCLSLSRRISWRHVFYRGDFCFFFFGISNIRYMISVECLRIIRYLCQGKLLWDRLPIWSNFQACQVCFHEIIKWIRNNIFLQVRKYILRFRAWSEKCSVLKMIYTRSSIRGLDRYLFYERSEHKGRICLLFIVGKTGACLCVLWSEEGLMAAGGVYAREERGSTGWNQ